MSCVINSSGCGFCLFFFCEQDEWAVEPIGESKTPGTFKLPILKRNSITGLMNLWQTIDENFIGTSSLIREYLWNPDLLPPLTRKVIQRYIFRNEITKTRADSFFNAVVEELWINAVGRVTDAAVDLVRTGTTMVWQCAPVRA